MPDNEGFWSISVYGDDGFMKSDHNVVNGPNVTLNDDGTTPPPPAPGACIPR